MKKKEKYLFIYLCTKKNPFVFVTRKMVLLFIFRLHKESLMKLRIIYKKDKKKKEKKKKCSIHNIIVLWNHSTGIYACGLFLYGHYMNYFSNSAPSHPSPNTAVAKAVVDLWAGLPMLEQNVSKKRKLATNETETEQVKKLKVRIFIYGRRKNILSRIVIFFWGGGVAPIAPPEKELLFWKKNYRRNEKNNLNTLGYSNNFS